MKKTQNSKKKTQKSTHSKKKKLCNVKEENTKEVTQKLNTIQNSEYFIDDCERVRGFALELYANPSHWGSLLEEAEHYAYIFHDKDVKEDGSLKTPHYHVLVRFPNAKTKTAVRKLTEIDKLIEDTTINYQRLVNPKAMYQYLMHNTKEAIKAKKTRYDEECIFCDNRTYWNDVTSFGTNDNETFIEDLLNKEFSARDMAVKYGRDYIRNYSRYEAFADTIRAEALRKKTTEYRNELFEQLNGCDNSEEESSRHMDKEVRDILTSYVAGCIIEAYRDDKAYIGNSITPSESARAYLNGLNDEIIKKVFGLI